MTMLSSQILRLLGLFFSAAATSAAQKPLTPTKRPNILFILADDQDYHMTELEHMPSVQKHLVEQGTTFERHYCTVSLCCPSRVNIWTGQLAHNTNVTAVKSPHGGWEKICQGGYHENHLALWLQESGYNTYYTGKLYNDMKEENHARDGPIQGYNQTELHLDPYTYQYYNISTTRNSKDPRTIVGKYSPDFTADTAYEFLEEALGDESRPWFLTVAPIAPHCEGTPANARPPQCAERHKDMFKDYKIPRTQNFNPDKASGAGWVKDLPKLNDDAIEFNDEYQRQRLRSLQSVDEMVEQLVSMVEEAGVMSNTHIFYSSDNGYHISQHRLHPGKMLAFEEDIRVPLVWRGPGIPKGETKDFATSHSDMAPTILEIAELSIADHTLDGLPIELKDTYEPRGEHVQVEYWGGASAESELPTLLDGDPNLGVYPLNTYKALRIESAESKWFYSVWCTDEYELYDMKEDPLQMNNLILPGTANSTSPNPTSQLVDRLDALLMVLKSCKEEECRHPWKQLHPEGNVYALSDAMSSRYDSFYEAQPKNKFDVCTPAYIPELEGPQEYETYEKSTSKRRRSIGGHDWSFWE